MTRPAPLDRATGRTSPTEAGGSALGSGPFDKDLHETPLVLWVSVALICLGAALLGGGVVSLSKETAVAVALFATGSVLAVAGGLLGLANGIMSNVD